MKIIEERSGSFMLQSNINYSAIKKQLVGVKTENIPRVKIEKISFRRNKHEQYQIRKLNKWKHISPRPLTKKYEICFSSKQKLKNYKNRLNDKMMENKEKTELPDLMFFLLQKMKESDMSNKSDDVDTVPRECTLRNNSFDFDEGEDREKLLRNAENANLSDDTFVTAMEGRTAENSHSEFYSTAQDFSESEDTLTRELKERLRKRKKAAIDFGEPSEKSVRYDNKDSNKEDEARTEISHSSEQLVTSSSDIGTLDCSIPQFTSLTRSLNPQFRSTPLKQNPFSASVNNADVVVEGDFDDELLKSMEKNWKDRFSETDITEEENEASVPLQEVVEKLLNKPDLLDSRAIIQMKKGICFNFFYNKPCINNPCKFEHVPGTVFRKKLKYMPTSFIVQMMIAMKNDKFFVDVLLGGFDILKSRPNSVRFLPFVCFFVFYISRPQDSTFIGFWSSAAKHFTSSLESSNIADGFAHLLKIFRQIDQKRQPKIIDFLRLLKNSSLNLEMNWKLLEPVISLKVPSEFLIEAVESCNNSKVHVEEVLEQIISRILVRDLSTEGVEVLLRFHEILKAQGEIDKAVHLKGRLRSKVRGFDSSLDKNKYPQTYAYFLEIKLAEQGSCDIIEINEEEEERNVEIILKEDEERKFSPPPPNCFFNPCYLMTHKTLPRNLDNRPRVIQSTLKRNKKRISEKAISFDKLIVEVVRQIRSFEFTPVGKALNYFHFNDLFRAADKIVQTILQMSIEPHDVLTFFQTVALNCNTKNSFIIISSVAMTMIVFFIRIPDWSTAYSIWKTCDEYELELSNGEVFSTTESEKQILNLKSRKRLLLFETCLNNDKLEDSYRLMEKFDLFSSDGSSCDSNENLKEKLMKEFIDKIIDCELTGLVYNTFMKIWEAQGGIDNGIDLREYANEFLILLFNDNKISACNYYKKLLPYNCLKETTVRTIIVELVGLSRISEAESLMQTYFQTTYKLPIINGEPMALTIPSYWTKEEIFVVLDLFLDKLTKYFDTNHVKIDAIFRVQIFLQKIDKSTLPKEVRISPKSLKEGDSSLLSARAKLDEVLNDKAFSFLTLYESDSQLIMDPFSLMKHLEHRSHL